ncbi:hypothetical protein QUB06_17260 [Microcoleus sp. D2_18a_D3]
MIPIVSDVWPSPCLAGFVGVFALLALSTTRIYNHDRAIEWLGLSVRSNLNRAIEFSFWVKVRSQLLHHSQSAF